jgi:hypothetical protein
MFVRVNVRRRSKEWQDPFGDNASSRTCRFSPRHRRMKTAEIDPTDTAAHHSWYYGLLELVKRSKGSYTVCELDLERNNARSGILFGSVLISIVFFFATFANPPRPLRLKAFALEIRTLPSGLSYLSSMSSRLILLLPIIAIPLKVEAALCAR